MSEVRKQVKPGGHTNLCPDCGRPLKTYVTEPSEDGKLEIWNQVCPCKENKPQSERYMLRRKYRCRSRLTARIVAWWWRRQGFETNIEKAIHNAPNGWKLRCFILTGQRTEYPNML